MSSFDKERREEKRPDAGDAVDFDNVIATYQDALTFIRNRVIEGVFEKLPGGGFETLVFQSVELAGMISAVAFIYGKDEESVRGYLLSNPPEKR